jgi:hypothetical protein
MAPLRNPYSARRTNTPPAACRRQGRVPLRSLRVTRSVTLPGFRRLRSVCPSDACAARSEEFLRETNRHAHQGAGAAVPSELRILTKRTLGLGVGSTIFTSDDGSPSVLSVPSSRAVEPNCYRPSLQDACIEILLNFAELVDDLILVHSPNGAIVESNAAEVCDAGQKCKVGVTVGDPCSAVGLTRRDWFCRNAIRLIQKLYQSPRAGRSGASCANSAALLSGCSSRCWNRRNR